MKNKQSIFVGDMFETNKYGKVIVKEYLGSKKILIEFLDYAGECNWVQAGNLRKGMVFPINATIKTLEQWIEAASKNQNNRYDYSHIKEKPKNKTKICVVCNKCGASVDVSSDEHMNGHGKQCSCINKDLITELYRTVSNKTPYILCRNSFKGLSYKQLVTATCDQHGDFKASLSLLSKGGKCCPKCKIVSRRLELLEEKSSILTDTEVLGFDSSFNYILLNKKTGEIKVYTPEDLKKKRNSPFELRIPDQRVTFDVFKERAIKTHGDAYEYSNYKSIGEKLTITHKDCGNSFEQLASGHINGNYGKGVGCPFCARYGLSLSRPTNLYVLVADNGYLKVGITHQSPEGRIRQIHKSSRAICLFKCFSSWRMLGSDAMSVEKELLVILKEHYKRPLEIFDGSTETFVGANPEDVCNIIKKLFLDMNILLIC